MRSHSARHHRGFTRLLLVLGVGLLLSTGMSCSRSKPASESPEETERTAEREIAPSGQPYSEDRAPCAHRDPQRQALWG